MLNLPTGRQARNDADRKRRHDEVELLRNSTFVIPPSGRACSIFSRYVKLAEEFLLRGFLFWSHHRDEEVDHVDDN